jgi:hypothetical protein
MALERGACVLLSLSKKVGPELKLETQPQTSPRCMLYARLAQMIPVVQTPALILPPGVGFNDVSPSGNNAAARKRSKTKKSSIYRGVGLVMSKDGQKYGYRAKYKGNIEGSFCGLRGRSIHEAMLFAAMAYDTHVKEANPSLHRKAANFCLTCERFRNPMQLSENEIMRIAECPVQICGPKCSGRNASTLDQVAADAYDSTPLNATYAGSATKKSDVQPRETQEETCTGVYNQRIDGRGIKMESYPDARRKNEMYEGCQGKTNTAIKPNTNEALTNSIEATSSKEEGRSVVRRSGRGFRPKTFYEAGHAAEHNRVLRMSLKSDAIPKAKASKKRPHISPIPRMQKDPLFRIKEEHPTAAEEDWACPMGQEDVCDNAAPNPRRRCTSRGPRGARSEGGHCGSQLA